VNNVLTVLNMLLKKAIEWDVMHWSPDQANVRDSHLLNVAGRLKRGVSVAAARDDMESIARRLSTQYPDSNRDIGIALVPAKEEMLGNTRLELLVRWARRPRCC